MRNLLGPASGSVFVVVCALGWAGCSGGSSPAGGGDASTGSSSGGGSSGASSSGGDGGGSSSSGGSSSGGSSSGGSSSGTPGDGGATCPTVPCAGSDTCCADLTNDVPTCAGTCAANDTIACLGPSDCGGSTPDCCATDVLDGADAGQSFPHCYTQSLTTKCVAKCVSSITTSCTATETLHVCTAKADCSGDTANPNCCLVAGYHVCVNNILKTLGGLTCL